MWVAPGFAGEYWLQLGFRLAIYLTLAEAWNLMAGSAGLVSLGTADLRRPRRLCRLRRCSTVSARRCRSALLAARSAGVVLAAIVSTALFRLRGLYFTVGTLALAEMLRLAMINISHLRRRERDLPAGMIRPRCPCCFATPSSWRCSLASAMIWLATRTRALRDPARGSRRRGRRRADGRASLPREARAFVLASALAAIAGGVQAVKLGAIEPYGMFGLQWSIDVLSMVIIGGVGLRLGPLVGALFVVALGEMLADYPEVHIAITGVDPDRR